MHRTNVYHIALSCSNIAQMGLCMYEKFREHCTAVEAVMEGGFVADVYCCQYTCTPIHKSHTGPVET